MADTHSLHGSLCAVAVAAALSGCTLAEPPPASALSDPALSEGTAWPRLLTRGDRQAALAGEGGRLTEDEIAALQAEAAALRRRGATLSDQTALTERDRARLADLLRRRDAARAEPE